MRLRDRTHGWVSQGPIGSVGRSYERVRHGAAWITNRAVGGVGSPLSDHRATTAAKQGTVGVI